MNQQEIIEKQFIDDIIVEQTNDRKVGDNIVSWVDLKLKGKGKVEDRLLAENPQLYQFCRRGLTYLVNQNGEQCKLVLRQGLRKFFDFNLDCIKLGQREREDQLKRQANQLHMYTLGDVYESLTLNPIIIHVLEKANGENAQFSYCKSLDAWSISSKNQTILCQNINDIELYTDRKHELTKLFAREWFKLIQDRIDIIKELLDRYTIVGEYCGNLQFQHLVKYEAIQFRFFAVVDKHNTIDTCIDPLQGFKYLNDMGLTVVNSSQILVHNLQELTEQLQQLYIQISQKPVEEVGEGVVIYFQCQTTKRCLSLGKLKTLDYRLWRKLREKLKLIKMIDQKRMGNNNANKATTAGKCFGELSTETNDLCTKVNYANKQQFLDIAKISISHYDKYLLSGGDVNVAKTVLEHHFIQYMEALKQNRDKLTLSIFNDLITPQITQDNNQIE